MKYFHWIAIAFVAVAVVGAFFLIGSPAHQRLLRFDERRLNDLQNIQYQISNYFAAKGQLPATLADMKGFEGFGVPLDPENGTAYEYLVKGPMQFQLCANFALASDDDQSENTRTIQPIAYYEGKSGSNSWRHPAGRGCFDIVLEKPVSNADRPFPSVTVKPAV